MPSIAIIGAGCSGLAAAHTLQDAGYTVTLFEKNDDVGGRATTGKRDGFIYDYGAQYIKGGSPASEHLVTERFRSEDLIDIGKPVWIFDGQGRIQEGDPVQNADPKWTYRNGLVTFARKMAEGLDVRFGVHVARIVQLITMDELSEPEFYMSSWPRTNLGGRYFQLRTSGWSFSAAREYLQEVFDQLLITLPASQAIELIDANLVSYDLREVILSILLRARYNPLLSVTLGYETRPSTRPYYALVNTDKAHPISWLAWEHEKSAERVPRGAGLLIAQMAPQYTLDHWDRPDSEIVEDVQKLVAALIHEPLPEPIFTDVQRWRYALPVAKANADVLNAIVLPHGLAFCGDGFVGGRVHLALEDGIRVAHQVIQGRVEEN